MEAAEVQRARARPGWERRRAGAPRGVSGRTVAAARKVRETPAGRAASARVERGLGRPRSNALLTNAAAAIVALLARVVVRSRSAARRGEGWPPRGLRSEERGADPPRRRASLMPLFTGAACGRILLVEAHWRTRASSRASSDASSRAHSSRARKKRAPDPLGESRLVFARRHREARDGSTD